MALENINKEKQLLGFWSHPQSTFNTKRELIIYDYITSKYKGFVINPNQYFKTPNPFEMNIFWRAIQQIDFMLVSTNNGKIGRASFYEIKQSLLQGITVHQILAVGRGFKIRKVVGIREVSKNLTKYAILKTENLK